MTLGLMCVHAHPDDEAIGTGGVLLQAADRGLRTAVVTCTGGELGEIVGAGMDEDAVRPRLGEVRRQELSDALNLLGAGEPRLLGYRDSGMIGTAGNEDPNSFWRAPFDQAVGRVVAQIREFRPDVVITYDAFGVYGHPDHLQTHRVTLVAVEAAEVPLLYPDAGEPWRVRKLYLGTIPLSFVTRIGEELRTRGLPTPFSDPNNPDAEAPPIGSPDEQISTAVDVRAVLDRKMAALRAHRSQLAPSSFFLNMPPEVTEMAFGTEFFLRQRSHVAVPQREDDLFAGLDA
jgi:N-acetyl-1-D-myo-inositol-2-amino-2-deoxy-alpha-D-glucopyranoside deacetylase